MSDEDRQKGGTAGRKRRKAKTPKATNSSQNSDTQSRLSAWNAESSSTSTTATPPTTIPARISASRVCATAVSTITASSYPKDLCRSRTYAEFADNFSTQ